MATLDETLVVVAEETTLIESLAALTAGMKAALAEALSGVTIPPVVQAKIDAVFDGVTSNRQKVADALVINTEVA